MTPLIHLVCGSTGAGKTTAALELAAGLPALHLSIDDWMTTLFWADSPQPIQFAWAMARVKRCEAQIWTTALAAARLGVASVLDLGFTKAEHRQRFYALAGAEGLGVRLHYVNVPAAERWRRVEARNTERGTTFRLEVNRQMFDFIESIWEPPGAAELAARA